MLTANTFARAALSLSALAGLLLFLLTVARILFPDQLEQYPLLIALISSPVGQWLEIHVFLPIWNFLVFVFDGRSPQQVMQDAVFAFGTSLIETVVKLSMRDVLNIILVGVIVPVFGLFFNRVRHYYTRRDCSTHLYVTLIKLIVRTNELRMLATKDQKHIQVNAESRALLHRVASELQVLNDFSLAYQQVFTRHVAQEAIRARIVVSPALELVEVLLAEINSPSAAKTLDLNVRRNMATLVSRGDGRLRRSAKWVAQLISKRFKIKIWDQSDALPDGLMNLSLFSAIAVVLYRNLKLAMALEGRWLWVIPRYGRTVPPSLTPFIRLIAQRQSELRRSEPLVEKLLQGGDTDDWLALSRSRESTAGAS